jgi:hypothetical protein
MDIWNDTLLMERGVEAPFPSPPVDDLLLVYLGQSSGSRAPESAGPYAFGDAVQDLWDYLGDFA